jgi:superfamily II DNA or RNA helicase
VKRAPAELTRPGALELRDYQRAAVAAADPAIERAVWVSGCGTGKTLMASAATAKLLAGSSGSALVLFPTLGLLEQTYRAWRAQFPYPFAALAVCSDKIGGGVDDEDIGSDELSVPSTTSPESLAQWLTDTSNTRIVFATYQSLGVITAAHKQFGARGWSVAVCDEAHRTAGRHGKPFAAILDQRLIPADHRLFFTATPREHTVPQPRGRRARRSVASMDDSELYGHRVFTLSTREAIERGILADFKVAVIAVSDSAVGAALKDVRLISLAAGDDGRARADHVAASIALTQAAADYELSSVLAFHNTIAASKEFAGTFARTHALLAAKGLTHDGRSANVTHIDGTSKLPARLAAVETLSRHDPDQWNVVTNARALTEGINIPSLDAVLFAEPRSSEVDVAQAVGRAIRKNPYHDRPSLIILSVTVDDTQDAENAIDISHFKRARQVLAALESHDPSIRQDLARVREALKDPPIGDDSGPISTDLLDIHLPADLPPHLAEQFLRAFSIHTVDTLTAQWEEALARLARYAADQGHSRPPQDYLSPDDFPLGRWVSDQRKRHSYGRLVRDRVDRLEELPGWAWNALDARWEENFAALASYADEHGHAYPPREYEAPTRANLNQWVVGLRRPGMRDKLSEQRRKRLEDLPGWSWDHRQVPTWEPSFAALVDYTNEYGHAAPPYDYVSPAGISLGEWVAALRIPSRKEKLGTRQRSRLEALPGWTWERGAVPRRSSRSSNRRLDEWTDFLHAVQDYSVEHGHASPPKRHVTDDNVALGRWVTAQRKAFAEGILPSAHIDLLEQLPGWTWNLADSRWEQNFGDLRRYIHDHDNAYPDRTYLSPTGANIDTWVREQRRAAAAGALSEQRRHRLESLPGWSWNLRDLAWEQAFAELAAYASEHGHANPLQGTLTASGLALGHWVSAQRVAYTRGVMAKRFPERIGRLEALPGWVWSVADALWEEGFAELTAFCEATGSAVPAKSVVTQTGHRLGQWAQDQRKKYRRGRLSTERSSRLQGLPGWFWEAPSADDIWNGYFEALCHFADNTGHARPRTTHVTADGVRLGVWVSKQRSLYLNEDMRISHPDRVSRLEALPGWAWQRSR